jgi:hypothetical protein
MIKKIKKAQTGKEVKATPDSSAYYKNQENIFNQLAKSEKGNTKVANFNREYFKGQAAKAISDQLRQLHKGKPGYDANGNPIKKQKSGGVTKAKAGKQMIKRKDGSTSQRGLWDNLRKKAAENKATGNKPKSPTKSMLTQEKRIKAKGK